jgi:hypothetical protein
VWITLAPRDDALVPRLGGLAVPDPHSQGLAVVQQALQANLMQELLGLGHRADLRQTAGHMDAPKVHRLLPFFFTFDFGFGYPIFTGSPPSRFVTIHGGCHVQ